MTTIENQCEWGIFSVCKCNGIVMNCKHAKVANHDIKNKCPDYWAPCHHCRNKTAQEESRKEQEEAAAKIEVEAGI